jgi:hypothetical protein
MITFADLRTRRLLLLNTAIMNARIAGWHIRSLISFNCPFSGRMRFVYWHFPLTEIHPHAEIAAESAEFASAAGLFWDMHDALFETRAG